MKLATIGSGMIVNLFLDAVSKVDGISCEAVYSRSQENANDLAKKFNVDKTYTSLNEMFNDPDIDVIYVASPNSLHFEQSKQALLANKHVICEKPLTSTVEELDELLKIAKGRKLFFLEAIMTIHLPNFHALVKEIENIGEIKMVYANFLQYSSKMNSFKKGEVPNVFNPKFSGGALMDLNVYNLHFVIGLFGVPNHATYHPVKAYNGIDVSGVVVLEYPSFNAVCSGAKNVQAKNNALIYGEQKTLTITGETSIIPSIEILEAEDKHYINDQNQENRMVYEVKDFLRIINENDFDAMNRLNKHSKTVYEVLHKIRKEAEIIFEADKGYNQ